MQTIQSYFSLVKFSHTIFALPFAAIGFVIGLHALPSEHFDAMLIVWVLLCMVTARNAAMAFNRWADKDIDALNPRTKLREIPAGVIHARHALIFVATNAILFVLSASQINPLCFALSPLALAIVLGYSYTKRFSWLCHLILGLGLSLAPLGAYLAVKGSFDGLPLLYSVAVLTWVAGFDIIYALQDIQFDQDQQLHSIPARFGLKGAHLISLALHGVCAVCILYATYLLHVRYGLSGGIYIGCLLFMVMLIMQQIIVFKGDLSKINLAFFTANGFASLALAIGTLIDFYF